ncbi:MAG: DUF389 domain-containing protein [Pseudomonadota bacterium]
MPDSGLVLPKEKKPFWQRWIGALLRQLSKDIDHQEVVDHVHEEGGVSGRYLFMTVMSCAVATLGLLLSSPAVIIGAMLISPLMGPIMLMGFSISILEWPALRTAIFAQACGILAALAIAYSIVALSPLKEATPEILARTQPNLFDLLVAVFSGLAGGYAVVHRKGETIVGVAIATALMPPLAVVGFGLAIGDWAIAQGSFFLFMTNLLAIAFCVVGLSKLYGFGEDHSPRHTVWQSILIFLVLGALAVPLGVALRDIAYQTTVSSQVRSELLSGYVDGAAKISEFNVGVRRTGEIDVNAIVLTTDLVAGIGPALSDRLSERYDRPVSVVVDQVTVNEDVGLQTEAFLRMAENSFAEPLRARIAEIERLATERTPDIPIRNAIPFPLKASDVNPASQTAIFVAAPSDGLTLPAYRDMERTLNQNFQNWTITIIPPLTALPSIVFDEGSDIITTEMEPSLQLAVWALDRWQTREVEVVGYASSTGEQSGNMRLAERRANAVASWLGAQGLLASPVGDYLAYRQREIEREAGFARFRRVVVRPAADSAE